MIRRAKFRKLEAKRAACNRVVVIRVDRSVKVNDGESGRSQIFGFENPTPFDGAVNSHAFGYFSNFKLVVWPLAF